MATLVFTFLFMAAMVGLMAIGVLMGRKPISGSCGGMKALGMDVECEICGGNPDVCKEENQLTRRVVARLTRKVGK
ncbi:MAG: (Na+)-NQR maturation NqrM [Pseudomonadales bacterium]